MAEYYPLLYLILALILAATVTRWFNWLAWGQRRDRKLERMKNHRKIQDGKNGDNSGAGPEPGGPGA